ncbi:MAG: hypothetical protein CVV44_18930 [Spirochaetae bacterium HGW-Spirochaetae-1]|nr:MAG: hypothetical protein CVV44_18930 [Spirochaetae bacterium HGW-Spirochaetae-1]
MKRILLLKLLTLCVLSSLIIIIFNKILNGNFQKVNYNSSRLNYIPGLKILFIRSPKSVPDKQGKILLQK